MSDKELLDQVKGTLKRIPGIQSLNRIRYKILRIRELSDLIEKNKIIVFPEYSRRGNDGTLIVAMVHEVVKEWLDLYGIIHLRRTTSAALNSHRRIILLWSPMAVLEIPSTHEEYLKGVRKETRKAIRLAERQGYELKEFNWNNHLEEIYEINTSKEIRQSIPMRGWYREPVQPRHHSIEELQYRGYYGAFKDGILYAYFHFYMCGDAVVGKHFIGHDQHLKYGIMNCLLSYTIRECVMKSQIQWLYLGDWQRIGTLNAFKQHAGCQEYAILLDLEGDQELLKYSAPKVKTRWRI